MELAVIIGAFVEAVEDDPWISPVHISLYVAIVHALGVGQQLRILELLEPCAEPSSVVCSTTP
jgi:hypothetical protein